MVSNPMSSVLIKRENIQRQTMENAKVKAEIGVIHQ